MQTPTLKESSLWHTLSIGVACVPRLSCIQVEGSVQGTDMSVCSDDCVSISSTSKWFASCSYWPLEFERSRTNIFIPRPPNHFGEKIVVNLFPDSMTTNTQSPTATAAEVATAATTAVAYKTISSCTARYTVWFAHAFASRFSSESASTPNTSTCNLITPCASLLQKA